MKEKGERRKEPLLPKITVQDSFKTVQDPSEVSSTGAKNFSPLPLQGKEIMSHFCIRSSSFLLHPFSFLFHPSSFLLSLSSFILSPSSFFGTGVGIVGVFLLGAGLFGCRGVGRSASLDQKEAASKNLKDVYRHYDQSEALFYQLDDLLRRWNQAYLQVQADREGLEKKLEVLVSANKDFLLDVLKKNTLSKFQPVVYGVLGFSKDCAVVPLLLQGLSSSNRDSRADSALSLGLLSACDVPLEALIQRFRAESEPSIQINEAFSLFRLIRREKVQQNPVLGNSLRELTLEYLNSSNILLENEFIRIAGKLALADAKSFLYQQALNDPVELVRLNAAVALSNMGGQDVVKELVQRLQEKDFIGRQEAVYALERLTGQNFGLDTTAWVRWLRSQ